MFGEDLNKAKIIEKEVAMRLLSTAIKNELDVLKIEFAPNKVRKDWDIKMVVNKDNMEYEKTYEVKNDMKSEETGNIGFEYMCNGKPSWIYASKADYIVYKLGNDYWYSDRAGLLIKLNNVEKKSVDGWDWDNAKMYLVKKDNIDLIFKRL